MKLRQSIATLYVILFAALGVGVGKLFIDANAEYSRLKQAESTSRRRLAEAQEELAKQERILQRLRTDPEYVEKVLRRRGYAKPGDVIFRFEN